MAFILAYRRAWNRQTILPAAIFGEQNLVTVPYHTSCGHKSSWRGLILPSLANDRGVGLEWRQAVMTTQFCPQFINAQNVAGVSVYGYILRLVSEEAAYPILFCDTPFVCGRFADVSLWINEE